MKKQRCGDRKALCYRSKIKMCFSVTTSHANANTVQFLFSFLKAYSSRFWSPAFLMLVFSSTDTLAKILSVRTYKFDFFFFLEKNDNRKA